MSGKSTYTKEEMILRRRQQKKRWREDNYCWWRFDLSKRRRERYAKMKAMAACSLLLFVCSCATQKPLNPVSLMPIPLQLESMSNADTSVDIEVVNPPPTIHVISWPPSADSDVVYEIQHSQDLYTFTLFGYTTETNIVVDMSLPADFFIVRAVRNNGFHSSETSDWAK